MGDFVKVLILVILPFAWLVESICTADKTIINSCKTNGYWQTGQTRVICHVEEKKS